MDWGSFDLGSVGRSFNRAGLIVHLGGEGEDGASALEDYTAAQRAALEFFVENEDAVYDALCDALEAHVAALEAAHKRAVRQARLEEREEDELVYGEKEVDEEVDDEVLDLFDDPEDDEEDDEDDDEDDDEPIYAKFKITTLVLLPGNDPDLCALGFKGNADWEQEHGLGVVMEGFEVVAIGYQDIVG